MRLNGLFWMILTNICTASISYLLLINVIYTSDNSLPWSCPYTREVVLSDGSLTEEIDQMTISNCSTDSDSANCTFSNSKCNNSSVLGLMEISGPISCLNPETALLTNNSLSLTALKTVLAITPTYKRLTQKLDLVSLCQTIMHVPNFLWIVIEDSAEKTDLVRNVLKRCNAKSVHLNVITSKTTKRAVQRGVEQRNAGLDWIRTYCNENCLGQCNAVVYFMDDDNKYDLRLFQKMRETETVSVFPVGYSGGLAFEGPICKDGKAVAWQAVWQSKERHIPVDMAAFAINVKLFLQKPMVKVGYRPLAQKRRSKRGFMESDLIKSIGSSRDKIECRGAANEVLVWHVKTTKPFISYKSKYPSVEV